MFIWQPMVLRYKYLSAVEGFFFIVMCRLGFTPDGFHHDFRFETLQNHLHFGLTAGRNAEADDARLRIQGCQNRNPVAGFEDEF